MPKKNYNIAYFSIPENINKRLYYNLECKFCKTVKRTRGDLIHPHLLCTNRTCREIQNTPIILLELNNKLKDLNMSDYSIIKIKYIRSGHIECQIKHKDHEYKDFFNHLVEGRTCSICRIKPKKNKRYAMVQRTIKTK